MNNNGGNIFKRAGREDAADSPRRPAPPRGVVKQETIDAQAEARRLIAAAEREASALRERAAEEASTQREAAYREGYEKSLAELNAHLLEARERRDKALADVEQDVLRLSVKLAEKIIGREIARDEGVIADIVATALRAARRDEALTIRLNPADGTVLEQFRGRLDPAGRARFLDFVTDPQVKRGGCLIESESGTIDAQLETQLRALERALLELK